ncbi:hypothetical protein F4824DRAFT_452228 [Ustulina deusta]|nr:hypothetical protein F4824DRAFT_452228 [Ustulina deusta]
MRQQLMSTTIDVGERLAASRSRCHWSGGCEIEYSRDYLTGCTTYIGISGRNIDCLLAVVAMVVHRWCVDVKVGVLVGGVIGVVYPCVYATLMHGPSALLHRRGVVVVATMGDEHRRAHGTWGIGAWRSVGWDGRDGVGESKSLFVPKINPRCHMRLKRRGLADVPPRIPT